MWLASIYERRGTLGWTGSQNRAPQPGFALRCFAVVVVQQTAEPLAALDFTEDGGGLAFDQSVVETLGIALSMIVLDELGNSASQRSLAEEDHPI